MLGIRTYLWLKIACALKSAYTLSHVFIGLPADPLLSAYLINVVAERGLTTRQLRTYQEYPRGLRSNRRSDGRRSGPHD